MRNSYVTGWADNYIDNDDDHSLTNTYKGSETQDEDGSDEYGKSKIRNIGDEYGKTE